MGKARISRDSIRKIRRVEQASGSLSDSQIKSQASQLFETCRETADKDRRINKTLQRSHFSFARFKRNPQPGTNVQLAGLVCEAIFRTQGFRLYDVQVQAMLAGGQGTIVEMQTGEGKTVVTGATAALLALKADSVHVGTTNAYLATRDLESLAPTFEILGLSYGLLPSEHNEMASRRAYTKQIVYGPGYQFGFDYLQDQMSLRHNRQSRLGVGILNRLKAREPNANLIQQGHHISLIDEADSVMIDEAMTPLIISLPGSNVDDPAAYQIADRLAVELEEGVDYEIDTVKKTVDIDESTQLKCHEKIASVRDLELARPWRVYISNAVRALKLMHRNIDYVVVEDEVQIVDQNTGRIFPDRTWQSGLHQAVEAKEGVPIKPGRDSTTQITRQRYLQLYDQIGGLTGTARTVAAEFDEVYGCKVIQIPTNVPCIRQLLPPRFFVDDDAKLAAITSDVVGRHKTGQPILIGTKTIAQSLQVQSALESAGLAPTILNGIQDAEEADVVARAGDAAAITIATNMAGRGTDIKLDATSLANGGLHVIGVCPNDSTRIDRQLVGRAARQGQPGSAQFFVAATDKTIADNAPSLSKRIAKRAKASGESTSFSRELLQLQNSISNRHFQQRSAMILRDRWMDTVREAIEKE